MHPQSSSPATIQDQQQAMARVLAAMPVAAPERPALAACAALAYARVSKSVQDSIDDQLLAIRRDAARHGIAVARERYDTGSRWDNSRVYYQALKADIASGQYSHLWLFKADRLGGDDVEFITTVRLALRKGMSVRDTVIGEINDNNVSMLGFLSHMEIKADSDRVLMRLEGKADAGVKIGAVPLGYAPQCRQAPCRCGRHGYPLPDTEHPERIEAVQALFRDTAAGQSLGRVRMAFNAALGLRKSAAALKLILRNPYYAGWTVNGKTRESIVLGHYGRPKGEWIVRRHEHPLVDQETFDRVQARLDGARRVGQNRQRHAQHPLVGLLWCVRCRRRMHVHKHRSNRSWQCPICLMARGQGKLDRAVRALLATVPSPDLDAAEHYAARAGQQESESAALLAEIDAALDAITRKRSVWADMVAAEPPEMSREDYRLKVAETERERLALRERRESLAARQASSPAGRVLVGEVLARLRALGNWTETLDAMDPQEQRTVYQTLIARLEIDPEGGTLTARWTEALAERIGSEQAVVPFAPQVHQKSH